MLAGAGSEGEDASSGRKETRIKICFYLAAGYLEKLQAGHCLKPSREDSGG